MKKTFQEKINAIRKFKNPCCILHPNDFKKLHDEIMEETCNSVKFSEQGSFVYLGIECFEHLEGKEGEFIFLDKSYLGIY